MATRAKTQTPDTAERMLRASRPEPGFFDLSFTGGLPEILRKLAVELEERHVHGESFSWRMTEDRLELSACIQMRPKG